MPRIKNHSQLREQLIKSKERGLTIKQARNKAKKSTTYNADKISDMAYNVYVRDEKRKAEQNKKDIKIKSYNMDDTPLKQFWILDSNFKHIEKDMALGQLEYMQSVWEKFRKFLLEIKDWN